MIEIMIVMAIIGIVVAIAVPGWWRQRTLSQQRVCQENMYKIDGAKEQWALENRLPGGTTVALDILHTQSDDSYINYNPECPAGGIYTLGTINESTVCDITEPLDHNEGRLPGASGASATRN